MSISKLDILAFGAHPDDVELGCGGTILSHIKMGKKIGIADLTGGELGTRGTAEIREREADIAAGILGVEFRINLNLPDGFLENSKESKMEIVKLIRQYRPEIVLATATEDRHPDHGIAAQLVSDACFISGLRKVEIESLETWRPKAVYHYIQFKDIAPSVVVDISDFYEQKMEAVKAHKSQFYDPDSKEPETVISSPEFLGFVEAKAIGFGKQIGVAYGEGFTTNRYIGTANLFDLI